LNWLQELGLPFYLTGGTALARFYLNHRYSDDLDFFTNANSDFSNYIEKVNGKIKQKFDVNVSESLFTEDFCRFFISENEQNLKIEFVNDVEYRVDKPYKTKFGLIDTVENILANKITAIIGRDEPKDVFDIIYISENYAFNWSDVFLQAKQKSAINEIDIEQRLNSFPILLLENIKPIADMPDLEVLQSKLSDITDDFLLGKENRLGEKKLKISEINPQLHT
jgi:predicted nucleotidyltransferase component of viral defense system